MDRRIDERLRKPRSVKGTPFYIQRNYWAAGVILLGGFSWFLLELTPGFKFMRKYQREHINPESEEFALRRKHIEISRTDPVLDELIIKAKERIVYKDEPTPQGMLAKFFAGTGPDV